MNKDLFDLDLFESAKDNLMDLNIEESAEFEDHCPSMDPTKHFDADNSGEHGIPVPAKTTLDSKTYNDMIEQLQNSFKEGYEIMEFLRNVAVVEESVEELQAHFTEDAISTAILESLENGPFFEKVDRSDKDAVKKIVAGLRDKLAKSLKSDNIDFYVPKLWAPVIAAFVALPLTAGAATGIGIATGSNLAFATGAGAMATAPLAGSAAAKSIHTMISARMWQVLGVCYMEDGNINKLADALTEKFKDELGEYKILPMKTVPDLRDAFKTHFGWKDNRKVYMLLVDKKLPQEVKQLQEELIEDAKEEVKKGKKEEK